MWEHYVLLDQLALSKLVQLSKRFQDTRVVDDILSLMMTMPG